MDLHEASLYVVVRACMSVHNFGHIRCGVCVCVYVYTFVYKCTSFNDNMCLQNAASGCFRI